LDTFAEPTEEHAGACAQDVFDNLVIPFLLVAPLAGKQLNSEEPRYALTQLIEDTRQNAKSEANDNDTKECIDAENIYKCLRSLCTEAVENY